MPDKTLLVYPSSKLSPTEYVAGLSPNGSELPADKAQALIDAGLAVKNKPAPPAKPKE